MPPTQNDNYYALLGVKPNASASAIKKAYRREVRKYHPDKYEGNDLADLARERLTAINQAYDVLKDPVKRREYDALQGGGGTWGSGPPLGGQRLSAVPRFLRPVLWMLGIAGFGIMMKLLRNPRVWLIVAAIVGLIWFLTKKRPPPDNPTDE